jgi:hypothetical protein
MVEATVAKLPVAKLPVASGESFPERHGASRR